MNESSMIGQKESVRLTDWAKEPTILEVKQDLQDAKQIHDAQVTKIGVWLDNLNITGKAKVVTPAGNSAIVPKLIRKQAEWRYASLSEPFLSTADIFNVKPKTWEDREAAQQNKLLLNHQFNTGIDKQYFIDEYIRAAVDEGTVIVRTGWEFEEEEVEVEVPDVQFIVNPEFAPMHEQLAELKAKSPSQYDTDVPDELKQAHDLSLEQGRPIEPKIIGKKMEKQMRTVFNRPTLEVCDYRNITIDPTCMGQMSKANFAVFSFETCLSYLEKYPKRYKNLDALNIEGDSILSQPDHAPSTGKDTSFNFKDKARKKLVAYEYWGFRDIDGSGKLTPIVCTWIGEVMIRMEVNPFPDKKLPFELVQYLPVRRSTHGEPDGALLEDNQKIMGAVTRGMIDIMAKSANGQTGISKGLLDLTNKRKFDKGLDYEFNPQLDPRAHVYMHTYPEIPNSAQFMLQLQNFEAESLTGVKSFSDGISGASLGDVAAGVRGALDAASKRELGILRRLSAGMVRVGRKMISMNSEFLSDEEVIRVTNDEFIKVRKQDLAGLFDLELSISTAEEDNNKAEQLAFMYQTSAPNGDAGLNKMILGDIARLRKMPDMAQKIEAYEPKPDPLMEKKMQLEIALLEAQIAVENAKASSLVATAQLSQAKVGTEGAKAENLSANTDKQNLDFVEQESGVTQERNKELHGEQARSQMQLKMVDRQFQREDNRIDLLKEYVKAKASSKSKK